MGTRDFLRWRDDWLLNIDLFDTEHQQMITLLNRLADTQDVTDEQAIEAHLKIFDSLIATIRDHFKKEEQFMLNLGYPNYYQHKSEHTMELAVFSSIRRELEDNKQQTLSFQMLTGIKSWFLDHVVSEDREYAEFYYSRINSKDDPLEPGTGLFPD